MYKLWVAALVLSATAAFTFSSPPAFANGERQNCFTVVGAANARNQWVSKRRAEKRMAQQLAVHLGDPAGVTVSPTTFSCILNACEASAIVCHN